MKNEKVALYALPAASTAFEAGGAFFCRDSILFEYYRDGVLLRSGVRFNAIATMRKRAERFCTPWHIVDAYDTLVEVQNSSWMAEITADKAPGYADGPELHHYLIYVDSSGCFELIADSWSPIEEEHGSWERRQEVR